MVCLVSTEHEAVTKARSKGDIGVLVGCLGVIAGILLTLFLIGLLLAATAESIGDTEAGYGNFFWTIVGYVLVAAVLLVFILVTIRIMRQMNLGNALQVEYSDYAWLRDWSNQVAADLQMPRVEIFVTQNPIINAYAFGFARPYNIVLHSGSIRYLTADELRAVVVHEMAHVKYGHTIISTYLSVLRSLPLVGGLFSWILDFWGRRTELTADRLALTYLKDPVLVKNSLVKVHVGPDVASSFNDVARQWQAHNTNTVFNGFSQTFSTHPFLVRRLRNIDDWAYLVAPPPPPPTPTTPPTNTVSAG